jgi:LAO/AO transport system kinase
LKPFRLAVSSLLAMSESVLLPVVQLVERLRAGDVRALGRAVSLVESGASQSPVLLAACFPFTGQALRIGITGSPGAGKSTLVDRLSRLYREAGKTVGVVAVDPSSPFTGGALLGDRIRFQGFAGDAGFYARSMATRGMLGGLARTTADVAAVIEASGKDVILIETVGVGQDEVDIVRLADVTIVVLVPGMGDDVQSLKAGILEIADVFVINKSDREGADALEGELKASMGLGHSTRDGGRVVPVVRTVALSGLGVSELAAAVADFQAWLGLEGRLEVRRSAQWRERILEMVRGELLNEIQRSGLSDGELAELALRVAGGVENPYVAVPRLLVGIRGASSTSNEL